MGAAQITPDAEGKCFVTETRRVPFPVRELVKLVCDGSGVSADQVYSRSRVQRVSNVRQEIMARAYQSGHTLIHIGEVLGRDHTTVLEGIRRAHRRRAQEKLASCAVSQTQRKARK